MAKKTQELAKNKCDELHPVAFTLAKESWALQFRVLKSAKLEARNRGKSKWNYWSVVKFAPQGFCLG